MSEASDFSAPGAQIAASLIRAQFPELSDRELYFQPSLGTDNLIIRIGDDLCARFPKVAWAVGSARREATALPRFAGAPLAVPEVYGIGSPTDAFPHPWSVVGWLAGAPLNEGMFENPVAEARRVAEFIDFVRSVPPDDNFRPGQDNNWRGVPLAKRDTQFETALDQLPDLDHARIKKIWTASLRADLAARPVWLHGDVHPGNLLIKDGRVSGVIDWGLCGVGDGACDLLSAWAVFDAPARKAFRNALGASDAEWLRGAGWALSMAVIYLPYAYKNGLNCDMSETMTERLMEEFT